MFQDTSYNFNIKYSVAICFFGLFLVAMLAVYPPTLNENFLSRKPLIGAVFGLICFLGILAAFFPIWCSRIFDFRKKRDKRPYFKKFTSHRFSSTLEGHHPDCGNFSAHVFRIGDKTFCVACTGLFLGGLLALGGSFLYFFGYWSVEQNSPSLVWIGILGVGFGLFQFKFRSFIRLFLNIFFVLGTLLILVGVDKLVHSVTFDLFVVALILFWLFTRISLSKWDHKKICFTCRIVNCKFAVKRGGRSVSTAISMQSPGDNQNSNDN